MTPTSSIQLTIEVNEVRVFPVNPAIALKVADIAIDLQHINDQSLIGMAISQGAKERPKEVIKLVYEQSLDSRSLISDVVGEKLLRKIEKLFV